MEGEKMKKCLTIMLVFTITFQLLVFTNLANGGSAEDFQVVYVNVRSSADTAEIYPGSKRVNLKIEAVYQNSTPADNVVGWLNTTAVGGIDFSAGSGSCSPARLLNGSVADNVSINTYITFEYLLDVSKDVRPGSYNLTLKIAYKKGGVPWEEFKNITLNVWDYPPIFLRVVDAYFSPSSYPGSVDTKLYIILENSGDSTITSAYFNLTRLDGFVVKNPRASTGLVNRGDRFTLVFTGISIPPNASITTYNATIYADCGARTADGVVYNKTTNLTVPVKVETPPPEQPIMLAAVNTLYNGEAVPLLPSARGIVLRVYLINRLPEAINAMNVSVALPGEVTLRAVSGTYINGMALGGTCFIDLTVDVDPKTDWGKQYNGMLKITYFKIISGASFPMNQTISFPINVESHHSYVSELMLMEAYWGYPDPTPVYSTSRYVPLTLRFTNMGRYPVWGVVVNASSAELKPIKDVEACATTVASGGSCTAVLYFDINAIAATVPVNVHANYLFTEFGAHIEVSREFTATLPIESYPASESIVSLVSAGWQNNWNVFPNTSNATYQVTLANRAPHSLAGISLKLKLPNGMTSKGRSEATAYVEGPVRSLATFTASFTISVDNMPPGGYYANLMVDCILLSGGPGVRRVEELPLQISVNDESSAIETVEARWYEGTVGPYTYGAHLIIIVRNVYVDGLRGAVLELELPEGFRNALDNSTSVKTPPLSVQLPQQLQAVSLAEVLNAFLSAQYASPAQVYGRGDILTFMASLNIFDVEIGEHTFHGRLSYIDAWGGNRRIAITVPVAVLGKAGYVEVALNPSLGVKSRYVNTTLTLVNHGSTPMHDVYIVVSPYETNPILIASPAVNYVQKVNPGGRCELLLTLAYNPLGFYAQMGPASYMTYGPVPLMVSVFYRDASGSYRTFNNSVTVVVDPFIELVIRGLKASGTNASSTVSGTLVNYGSSTAYRVEVEVKIGDTVASETIGDVGPGEEVAFRVDINKYNATALLTVRYYNIFNEIELKETCITITRREEAAPQTAKTQELPIEKWVIVAGVMAFLIAAALLIYRMMKKTKIVESMPPE